METQKRLKSILCLATIALLLSMEACDDGNNPSSLVGRWIGVSGKGRYVVMDLLSDGTGIINESAIIWKTENGRFHVTDSWRAIAISRSYKLQGSLLTLTEDEGEIEEWTKCQKDCQEAAEEYYKAKVAKAKKIKKSSGSFTDTRDKKSYKTLKYQNQTWMAENLNYNANGSKCYNNDESNCQKYGKFYDNADLKTI